MGEFTNQPAESNPPSLPIYSYPPPEVPAYRPPYKMSALLFVVTLFSTLIVGTQLALSFRLKGPTVEGLEFFRALIAHPTVLLLGCPYAFALMGILFAHEMGHYLACRYYGIAATLPYFIPFPNLIGTMGAFIRIRARFYNRRQLFDVGIAGPLAGFLVALPVMLISMPFSRLVDVQPGEMQISLGDSLIIKLGAWLFHLQAPSGMDVYLHPVAFAAWVGFLVTGLNLLPMGQLDGGHIIYALFGRFHRKVTLAFILVVIPVLMYWWTYWVIWAIIPLVLGIKHPPTFDDDVPLGLARKVIAAVALIIFILCFIPAPIKIS